MKLKNKKDLKQALKDVSKESTSYNDMINKMADFIVDNFKKRKVSKSNET